MNKILSLLTVAGSLLVFVPKALAAFVYQTPGEFLTSGDFNGDGVPDVLVLDKLTGNARVGYGSLNGTLTWSSPLVTGVENPTGCAAGRFQQTGHDTIAVTAPDFNRVNLVDLSNPAAAGAPVTVTPTGTGPHTLVALADPAGGAAPPYNSLLAASSFNTPKAELLDLLSLNSGAATPAGEFSESGPFDQGNALQLAPVPGTLAAGIISVATNESVTIYTPAGDGVTNFVATNTTLDIWQFTNNPAIMLSLTNLAVGSAYTYGLFTGDTLPRFLFYVPGQSNVTIEPLTNRSGVFAFGAPINVSFGQDVQGVYLSILSPTASPMGARSSSLPTASKACLCRTERLSLPLLMEPARSPRAMCSRASSRWAARNWPCWTLLAGSSSSIHAQVVKFNGVSFANLSSGNLPSVSTNTSRANLWLFEYEPFVNSNPVFISSLNDPDWTDNGNLAVSGTISVSTEHYGGTSVGLTNPVIINLGATPAGAAFALPNQVHQCHFAFQL